MNRRVWEEYFSFSAKERRGVIVLLSLIAVVILFPLVATTFVEPSQVDFKEFEDEFTAFIAAQDSAAVHSSKRQKIKHYNFSVFDPNHLSDKQWMKMGFSEKQTAVFQRHLRKVGFFCTPEDLKKVFIVDSTLFEQMRNFIAIRDTFQTFLIRDQLSWQEATEILERSPLMWKIKNEKTYSVYFSRFNTQAGKKDLEEELGKSDMHYKRIETLTHTFCCTQTNRNRPAYSQKKRVYTDRKTTDFSEKKAPSKIQIELNSATAEELVRLKGIGVVYANRIVKYREKLGGFTSVNQLKEVYGLADELLESIAPQLRLNATEIEKINISDADFKTLVKHPYIDKDLANRILNCRAQGHAVSLEKLNYCLSPAVKEINRLSPYLEFSPKTQNLTN